MGNSLQEHRLIAEKAIHYGACQKRDELAGLLAILAEAKPRIIVEIGSFAGGTLYAWQRVAPDVMVIGIDMMQEGPDGKLRNEHGATPIFGDSHDPETVVRLREILGDRPIDFLFIDGDHSYDGARQDYDMYSPLVRSGGLIAFHDIVTHNYQLGCEVVKVWCEVMDDSAVEIVSPEGDHWGGIGVLTKGGSQW